MDANEVKTKLSTRILNVNGVSGISASGGKLKVYLYTNSAKTRQDVSKIIRALDEARDVDIKFIVSGAFRAFGGGAARPA